MAGKGFKLADAYVEVHGDGTAVVDETASDVNAQSGKMKTSGLGIAKAFIGGFVAYEGFKAIGGFIGDSISAASDLNETVSASQAIFGASAGAISSWADNAATKMGLSKQAAIDAATSFGDMFLQIGFTGGEAEKNSTKIVQMAADLGSFKNLPTGDVLDMISGAMRGEYDSLQRVIPNINAARVEHEAMTETGKASASQLTAQEKAQATLNIITQDGSRAMGDFAKTSGGVANQQKIVAAQTEDLKATMGTALLPIVKTLLGVFTGTFLPMLKDVANWIQKNQGVIMPLVLALGILAAAIWVVNIALDANPIVLIIMGIMALIVAVVLLVTNWDAVVAWITTVWQGFINWMVSVMLGFVGWWNGIWAGFFGFVSDVWNGFIAWIQSLLLAYVAWIQGLLNGFLGWWNGLWAAIGQFVTDVWNGFIAWIQGLLLGWYGWITGLIGGFAGWWNGVWAGIASFINGIWSGIVSAAQGAWNGLISWFRGIPGMIQGIFNGAISWLSSIGSNIVNGLWNGLKSAWAGFMRWWNSTVGGIADTAKKILGIASPSRVFRSEVGVMIVRGAEDGIDEQLPSLQRKVRTAFDLSANASGSASTGMGAGIPIKSKQDAATYITIERLELNADQLSDMQAAIDTLKALAQAARQGKGATATVG